MNFSKWGCKLTLAINEARKSNHKQRMGAVIFKKKKIISAGHNYLPKSVRSITKKFIKYQNNIHAEIDAIIKAKTDLKGTSILVVRINNNEELRLAKPCDNCLAYIEFVGIKSTYFINRSGEIEKL